ncbi:MAG: TIGR02594 family protein [Flavobacteriaceae bacterium]|nr:TIGR02594 family protein [Flavobacteriaceae bacterium]
MNSVIEIALSQYGVQEFAGCKHNPVVMKYFSESGHDWVPNDETPWCSAFANWVMKKAGKRTTNKLNARSWEKLGVETTVPEVGDIVFLWRKSIDSPYGYVGFFIKEEGDRIYVLGGNQSNSVCIKPYLKSRLLSYRKI